MRSVASTSQRTQAATTTERSNMLNQPVLMATFDIGDIAGMSRTQIDQSLHALAQDDICGALRTFVLQRLSGDDDLAGRRHANWWY
jgi:hypothetical protein